MQGSETSSESKCSFLWSLCFFILRDFTMHELGLSIYRHSLLMHPIIEAELSLKETLLIVPFLNLINYFLRIYKMGNHEANCNNL